MFYEYWLWAQVVVYSCDGLYWIVGIYVVSIMQGLKRSFLLDIIVYETLCGHCVYWDRLYTGVVFW